MSSQQILLGSGGKAPATDLASFAGVSPTAATDVTVTPLAKKYCYDYQKPANGYNDVPGNNSNGDGVFITALGKCDEDNRGMWKNSFGSGIPYPTGLTAIDSVTATSTGNWYGGGNYGNPYDARNVTSFAAGSTQNDGAFIQGGNNMYADNNAVLHYITGRFNSGLGQAKGIVLQFFGNYAYLGYHHTPVIRVTINNVSRTYLPKGIYTYNTTTTNNNSAGNSGVVYYPSIYDWTSTSQIDSFFNSHTGTTISSVYFEY